jgi:hypothetical protein
MKAASIQEIKQELKAIPPAQLIDLCLRLARFKKENKELLTYLLFEAQDQEQFIENVKQQIDEDFATINISHVYFAKKTLRKILRTANRYIRYTGDKMVEAEVLLHYCINFKGLKTSVQKSTALHNIYQSQLKKIAAAINTMHEDLQHDYLKQLQRLK